MELNDRKKTLNWEQIKIYDERTKAEGILRNDTADFYRGRWISSMGQAEFDAWLASHPKQKTIACKAHGDYLATLKSSSRLGGVIIYSSCEKCEQRAHQIIDEIINNEPDRLKRQAEELIETSLLASGVDSNYMRARASKAIDYGNGVFAMLAGFLSVEASLIVLGACGIGKSFFGYALVEKYIREGKQAKVIKARDLVSTYKGKQLASGFTRTNDFENILEQIRGLDLIVLDEIDDGLHDSVAVRELVGYADSTGLRMVIVGNCAPEDLFASLGEKTASRLQRYASINIGNRLADLRAVKKS